MNVEHLIALVQDNEAVYDSTNPKHKDRDFIAGVWRAIARELNSTDVEVKTKWQHLRSNYMRERRKLKNSAFGLDGKTSPRITWPHYKLMWFLDPTLQQKPATGNVTDVGISKFDEDIDEHVDSQSQWEPKVQFSHDSREESLQSSHLDPIGSFSYVTCDDSEIGRKRKRSNETETETDERYLKHLKVISEKVDEAKDSDLMFLRSLLPFIKQLGPMDNLEFKGEVINLLKRKLQVAAADSSKGTIDGAKQTDYDSCNRLHVNSD